MLTCRSKHRRDHAAVSGAPRPPPARLVARLLSAVDFRPAVLELLNPRFPPSVRETAAAALRVAEIGPSAAFVAAHAPGVLGSGLDEGSTDGVRARPDCRAACEARGHRSRSP